jgi:hypothetical protein
MLVEQIAAGYWRTMRARKVEVGLFDNLLRTAKRQLGKDRNWRERDDEGCAVLLYENDPERFRNYFRYDSTISRDYYRAIATLEKMQAARRGDEDRQDRIARETAGQRDREPAAERASEPQLVRQAAANTPVDSIGFVSHYESGSTNLSPPACGPHRTRC